MDKIINLQALRDSKIPKEPMMEVPKSTLYVDMETGIVKVRPHRDPGDMDLLMKRLVDELLSLNILMLKLKDSLKGTTDE